MTITCSYNSAENRYIISIENDVTKYTHYSQMLQDLKDILEEKFTNQFKEHNSLELIIHLTNIKKQ